MKKIMQEITILSLSLMLISTFSISTALPAMLEYFNQYSRAQVELLISVPSFAITVMILLNTLLSKHVKERTMIAVGLLVMSISGITPVFIQDYFFVLITRILLGIGIGMINARAISIICEQYEGSKRVTLLGYRGSAEVLGNAVMTLAVGRILMIKWNYAFWVYALGFLIFALYIIFIPDVETKSEKMAEAVAIDRFTKSDVVFTIMYTIIAGISISINVSCSLRIPVLVLEKGYGTEAEASVVLSIMLLAGILAGICFGRLEKIFRKKLIVYGLMFWALGLVVLALAGNLAILVGGAMITGFFHSTLLICIFNGISERLPQSIVNTATSAVLVGCNLGAACTPIILKMIGVINEKTETPFIVHAFVLILIGVILLFGNKRKHRAKID